MEGARDGAGGGGRPGLLFVLLKGSLAILGVICASGTLDSPHQPFVLKESTPIPLLLGPQFTRERGY